MIPTRRKEICSSNNLHSSSSSSSSSAAAATKSKKHCNSTSNNNNITSTCTCTSTSNNSKKNVRSLIRFWVWHILLLTTFVAAFLSLHNFHFQRDIIDLANNHNNNNENYHHRHVNSNSVPSVFLEWLNYGERGNVFGGFVSSAASSSSASLLSSMTSSSLPTLSPYFVKFMEISEQEHEQQKQQKHTQKQLQVQRQPDPLRQGAGEGGLTIEQKRLLFNPKPRSVSQRTRTMPDQYTVDVEGRRSFVDVEGRRTFYQKKQGNKQQLSKSNMQHQNQHRLGGGGGGIRPIRVIYAIFSHDLTESEFQRRQMIRDTFLSIYSPPKPESYASTSATTVSSNSNSTADSNATATLTIARSAAALQATIYFREQKMNPGLSQDKEHWICSWNDFLQGKLKNPEKCRLAYVFVMAGNPNGTTLLLESNETYPLAIPTSGYLKPGRAPETDAIYLNIKENINAGKTPTWFRFVSSVLGQQQHQANGDDGGDDNGNQYQQQWWDLVYKSDSDNILFPPKFFQFWWQQQRQRRFLKTKSIRNVYGGVGFPTRRCDERHDPHCRLPKEGQWKCFPPGSENCYHVSGKMYMQGGCYFVSTDLAAFISHPSIVTVDLIHQFPDEDLITGLSVFATNSSSIQPTGTTTTTTTTGTTTTTITTGTTIGTTTENTVTNFSSQELLEQHGRQQQEQPLKKVQIVRERQKSGNYRFHPVKEDTEYWEKWHEFLNEWGRPKKVSYPK